MISKFHLASKHQEEYLTFLNSEEYSRNYSFQKINYTIYYTAEIQIFRIWLNFVK